MSDTAPAPLDPPWAGPGPPAPPLWRFFCGHEDCEDLHTLSGEQQPGPDWVRVWPPAPPVQVAHGVAP